jgi:hypothetical protein
MSVPAEGGHSDVRRVHDLWPLPYERKHRHLVTRRNASIMPLTLAFAVVACRLLLSGCRGVRRLFAAC